MENNINPLNYVKLYKVKGVTDEDRSILCTNGTQRLMDSRFSWTKTYLKKAGLISTIQRGYISLTEDGKKVVKDMPMFSMMHFYVNLRVLENLNIQIR